MGYVMIESNKDLIEKYLKILDAWKEQIKMTEAEIVKEDTIEENKNDNVNT